MSEEAKHTPGPWRQGVAGKTYIFAGSGDEQLAVAYVNREEDIPLIVAAPDLLVALRETQSLLVAMLLEKRPEAEIEAQIVQNRAALTKAGETI